MNWSSTQHRTTEWKAVKEVIYGLCRGISYGVRRTLQTELFQGEAKICMFGAVATGCHLCPSGGTGCTETFGRGEGRLEKYTLKSYRQLLYRDGNTSGRLLAWLLRWETPRSPVLDLKGSLRWDVGTRRGIVDAFKAHLERKWRVTITWLGTTSPSLGCWGVRVTEWVVAEELRLKKCRSNGKQSEDLDIWDGLLAAFLDPSGSWQALGDQRDNSSVSTSS